MIDGHRSGADGELEDDEELASARPLTLPTAPPSVAESTASGDVAKRDNFFKRLLKGIGPGLVKLGVSADHVTIVGLLVSAFTGVMIGLGHFFVSIVVLTLGGLMDTLDGAVAKAAGTSSKRGAFFDSVSDRIADMFVFGGLSWYFAAGPGHDPRLALLPFAILGVSNTISYERAKAESLGYNAKGGIMERAERLILLGIALALGFVLVPILWLLLGLCVVTAAQRFVKVWRQASKPVLAEGEPLRPRRPARVQSRWQAWRDSSGAPERRRRRVAVASRARSRRRAEPLSPLSTRLRRAFATERVGSRTSAKSRAVRSGRARSERVRSERRRQGASTSFGRGPGSGR
jgi:CDP-diacylglycerol--glycerol-3-phosphate 3-phosphatidyltransferase